MTSKKSNEDRLERALAEALEALKFYGESSTYFGIAFIADQPNGDFMEDFSETDLGMKPGKRARVAIGKVRRLLLNKCIRKSSESGKPNK